jgi:hypothetical protein
MSKKKKLISLSIAVLVLLLVGLFAYTRNDKVNPVSSNNTGDVNQTTKSEEKVADKKTEPAPTAQGADVQANNPPAENPAPAIPVISLTGKQQTGQTVQVSAIVKNLTAGTCQATFTGPQGTQPFARTSPIVNKGNFYGCTDMNIPVADFSKSGSWHMSIFAANQNNKSNIVETDIIVTK